MGYPKHTKRRRVKPEPEPADQAAQAPDLGAAVDNLADVIADTGDDYDAALKGLFDAAIAAEVDTADFNAALAALDTARDNEQQSAIDQALQQLRDLVASDDAE